MPLWKFTFESKCMFNKNFCFFFIQEKLNTVNLFGNVQKNLKGLHYEVGLEFKILIDLICVCYILLFFLVTAKFPMCYLIVYYSKLLEMQRKI